MSSYSIDTLEDLLTVTTGQCDLVVRCVMSYIEFKEQMRIKAEITHAWRCEQSEDDSYDTSEEDDFTPYNPVKDMYFDDY